MNIKYQHLKDVEKFLENNDFKYTVIHSYDTIYDSIDEWHSGKIINVKISSIDYEIIKYKFSHIPQNHQNKIYQIFQEQGFNEPQNWTPLIVDDFYGQFIEKFSLNPIILDNIMTQLNLYHDPNFYKE